MALTEADTFRELVEERDRLAVALKAAVGERDEAHSSYNAWYKQARIEAQRAVALEAENQRLRDFLRSEGYHGNNEHCPHGHLNCSKGIDLLEARAALAQKPEER